MLENLGGALILLGLFVLIGTLYYWLTRGS